MARLGELLVAAGVLEPAQLEEALRAQVIHGARLGTNLVELGHVELDQIAVALARQHGLPPAMRRHFERCDPEVQASLPSALAARHLVVPIGFVAGDETSVIVACRDPLSDDARDEIEEAMGLRRGGLVPAICGELRIRYFLERAYAIPRPNRFLRVRRATSRPDVRPETFTGEWGSYPGHLRADTFPDEPSHYRSFEDTTGSFRPAPPADHDDDDAAIDAALSALDAAPFEPTGDFHIEETPVDHIIDPPAPGTSWRRPTRTEPPPLEPPPPVEVVPTERALPLGGEELRRFVDTLADPLPGPALGRIALRTVSVKQELTTTASGRGEVAEAADVARILVEAGSIAEVARAIRRARGRNRVGELAIGALRRFGDGLDAAVLFVVREEVAIGWKGFARDVDDLAVDDLAVPLDAPTLLAAAAREARALLIDGAHGTDIDRRLWAALGHSDPGEVAVAPVFLADHPVCLVYGQGATLTRYAELFAAVTQATTTAFARLLDAAQR